MSYSAEMVNSGFIERLETEGSTKTAAASLNYIKDRLRESSFADMIVPNERVVRGDLQRSTEHDTMVKIVDIEPGSRAMAVNFRGQPTAEYVNGKRFAISFFTISSLKFEIVEQELMAYEMPVTKLIEENSLKDMVEVKDREFLNHVESCIDAMQEEGNTVTAFSVQGGQTSVSKVKGVLAQQSGDGATTFTTYAIQRADIVAIKKLLKRQVLDSSGNIVRAGRLRPVLMLMTESDSDDFDQWTHEDYGDKLQSETALDGFTYNKVLGLRIVRTIKNDILREGNVYVFTAPEFFGRNYTLNDVKFYIDKVANRIFWQAWMDVGMGFGNIASVVKLELYAGDATDSSDTVSAGTPNNHAVIPVSEVDIGTQNNKVAEGLTFPNINVF
jgi:hypothetical protein